jgi:hypothetical protein
MSEHEAPPQEDTPTTADSPEVDWRKRYEDLQPDYTRKSQRLSEVERLLQGEDEDTFRTLMSQYGYEVADDGTIEPDTEDTPDDEPYDEAPVADPRVDKLLEFQARIEQAMGQQRFTEDLNKTLSGREVDEIGQEWIRNRTAATGDNPAALEKAVNAWFEREEKALEAALQAHKQSKRAPHVPAAGKAATQVPDLDDPNARRQWMAQRFADLSAD